MLQHNTHAPDFTLFDQDGIPRSLKDFLGKWVVVYFYPKDDTPGCTKEACGFQDSFAELQKQNVVICGISKDSVKSHKKFAEKYHLSFFLLSDPEGSVIEKYDAWGSKKFMGKSYDGILRITYGIDPAGNIALCYDNVSPQDHAKEILSDIQGM